MTGLRTLMFAVAVALAGGWSATAPALAQETPSPEALQAARDLTSITSASMVNDLITNMTDQVWPTVETAFRSKDSTISGATLAEMRREFERQQSSALVANMNEVAAIYARHFTVQEMREMAAFYRTPTGKKAMSVMPQFRAELMQAMAPRLENLETKVSQAMIDILHRHGHFRDPPNSGAR